MNNIIESNDDTIQSNDCTVLPNNILQVDLSIEHRARLYSRDEYNAFGKNKKLIVYEELCNEYRILSNDYYRLTGTNIDLKGINMQLSNRMEDLLEQIIKLKNINCDLKDSIAKQSEKISDQSMRISKQSDKISDQSVRISKQSDKIAEQEDKIKELKIDNKKLRNDMDEMRNEIYDLRDKDLYNKYVIAIQDVNRTANITNGRLINNLTKLKKKRIYECHYLDDNDDPQIIDFKRTILYDKINDMPNNIRKKFDTRYPKMLDDILSYVKDSGNYPNADDYDEINEWWD